MNVVLLTPWYPNRNHRYGGVFVREYAKALQVHCNVLVLHCGIGDSSPDGWWTATKESDAEFAGIVPVYRVAFRPSAIPLVSFARYLASVHLAVAKLSREFGAPDLIHAHVFNTGWPALLVGTLRRIPVVISEHWTAFPRGILSRSQIYQARSIYRMADAVLPVSHALQRSLERHGVKAAFQVIPNAVDTDLFAFQPRPAESPGVIRVLTVTSLVKHKGVNVLLRALKSVAWRRRSWRLDIVGDGTETAELHLIARKLGLASNVVFHGQLPKNEVAQIMRQADLFVLPSLVETFSVATAEALASGLPVVVTRCGGPEEFVNKHSGVVVPPGDAAALAQGLTNMIDRLPMFDRSVIAEEACAQFGSARVGAMLHDLYVRLVYDRVRSTGHQN